MHFPRKSHTLYGFLKELHDLIKVESESISLSVMSDSLQPMDGSPPDSSVHGILQARILEWVAISFSRESSGPSDRTLVSCIAGRLFTD